MLHNIKFKPLIGGPDPGTEKGPQCTSKPSEQAKIASDELASMRKHRASTGLKTSVVVSIEINSRHYFLSNLHI